MRKFAVLGLSLWLAAVQVQAAPYVPRPGDLAPQDQPSEAQRERVRRNAQAYQGAPAPTPPAPAVSRAPASSPAPRPTGPAFTPRPYVPDGPITPISPSRPAATPQPPLAPPPAPPVVAPPPAQVSQPPAPLTPPPAPVTPPPAPVTPPPPPPVVAAPPAPLTPPPAPVTQPPAPVTQPPRPPVIASPPPPLAAPPASSARSDHQDIPKTLESRLKGMMGAYRAKDWDIILTYLHPQVYVLLRSPKGEQGTLGYKQLTEAYYQQIQSANAPALRLLETKVEPIKADRAKMWARLEAVVRRDSNHTITLAVILEAEWLRENNAWLITDAVIQHDAP